MQAIVKTDQYPDLYRFLAALAEVSYSQLSEPKLADKTHDANSIFVWSPEGQSDLLDCCEKVEIVEQHARKLGVQIVLSAASNLNLRQWGHQVGWTVLWDVPALDHAANPTISVYAETTHEEATAGIAC